MPPIDKIKGQIDTLRDDYKHIFMVFFTVLTGSIAVIYKILTLDNPIYLLFLVMLGFVVSSALFVKVLHIREDIKKLQDKLGDL